MNTWLVQALWKHFKRGLPQPSFCILHGPLFREFTVGNVGWNLPIERVELNLNLLKSWWILVMAEWQGAWGGVRQGFLLDLLWGEGSIQECSKRTSQFNPPQGGKEVSFSPWANHRPSYLTLKTWEVLGKSKTNFLILNKVAGKNGHSMYF